MGVLSMFSAGYTPLYLGGRGGFHYPPTPIAG